MAIKRVWHGWTTPENAAAYEELLKTEVFPGIEAKGMPGYLGIELLRREHDDEVEFVTLMTFSTLQDIKDFQGEDYARAYVPDSAQKLLKRWNRESAHFEIRDTREYG